MNAGQEPPMEKVMAYLDGEMSRSEAAEFRALLDRHPEWRAEVENMAELADATDRLSVRVDPVTWDNYWEEIDDRLGRHFGWTLALFGSVVLVLWGFVKSLLYAQNPWAQLGLVLLGAGLVTLLVVAVRGRFLELPKDRYTRIRR